MAEKNKQDQRCWDSLASRKRKIDSISRHQSKMLRIDAEYNCEASGESSTNFEIEDVLITDRQANESNINVMKTQRSSLTSLDFSDNSNEVIEDTDDENNCANINETRIQRRLDNIIKIEEQKIVSKHELKRYLRSAKYGENSVVVVAKNTPTKLPTPFAKSEKRQVKQFSLEVLKVESAQTEAESVTTASEIKNVTSNNLLSAAVVHELPVDYQQDSSIGDVVHYASDPKTKNETTFNARLRSSDFIDDPSTDLVDISLGDVAELVSTHVMKDITETTTDQLLTANLVHEPPEGRLHNTSYDSVELEAEQPKKSCTDITPDFIDEPQQYTTLETVNFEPKADDIEEYRESLSMLCEREPIVTYPSLSSPHTSDHDVNYEKLKSNKKRRNKNLKSYIDFLSDNEDFSAGSSELWSMNESDSSNSDSNKKKKKNGKETNDSNIISREKTKKPNKNKIRKQLKNTGKSYETKSGQPIEEKTMKENPCLPGKCARKCYLITNDRRMSLFRYFWNLEVQRRRDWLVRCVKPIGIKRKKTKAVESRRSQTFEYVINEDEGYRPVCQKFLINTLDITQKYILYTINNSYEGMASTERRTSHFNKYSDESKQYAKAFIETLPAAPSHYSRKKSTCLYLPQELKNTSNLFRLYCNECQTNGKEHVSERVFRDIFNNDYNLRFHVPKKDKCVICTKVENTNVLTEKETKAHVLHLEEKSAGKKRFKVHQNLNSKDTLTVSFDLQKVLNTPHGESMLLYYSRKYAVYNCTFYESQTKRGHCYIWGECDGKRGGNEISTCIFKFLQEVDEAPIKNVILYCDSCPGQNKNKIVLTALHHFLQTSKNIEVIQINYLLPGHTYMPVDSMHAVIEREVRRVIVWSPSQWPTYMESARKCPEPYKINVLEHSDFINWATLVSDKFDNISQKQLQLKAMRIVTMKKKNYKNIEVKYSMKDNEDAQIVTLQSDQHKKKEPVEKGTGKWKGKGKGKGKGKRKGKVVSLQCDQHEELEPIEKGKGIGTEEVQGDISSINLPTLYVKRIPISDAKYNDLKRLCDNGTIPKRYHKEYLDLPRLESVKDVLSETDEDDCDEDIEKND